jgi:hypothetical protein
MGPTARHVLRSYGRPEGALGGRPVDVHRWEEGAAWYQDPEDAAPAAARRQGVRRAPLVTKELEQ